MGGVRALGGRHIVMFETLTACQYDYRLVHQSALQTDSWGSPLHSFPCLFEPPSLFRIWQISHTRPRGSRSSPCDDKSNFVVVPGWRFLKTPVRGCGLWCYYFLVTCNSISESINRVMCCSIIMRDECDRKLFLRKGKKR